MVIEYTTSCEHSLLIQIVAILSVYIDEAVRVIMLSLSYTDSCSVLIFLEEYLQLSLSGLLLKHVHAVIGAPYHVYGSPLEQNAGNTGYRARVGYKLVLHVVDGHYVHVLVTKIYNR